MKKLFKQCTTLLLLFSLINAIAPLSTQSNSNPAAETQGDNDKNPPDTGITNYSFTSNSL